MLGGTLADTMAALNNAAGRITKLSGNINYSGANIDAVNNAYMDYITGKGSLGTVYKEIAKGIGGLKETGLLTEGEAAQLDGLKGELEGYIDSTGSAGDNGISEGVIEVRGRQNINKDEQLKTEPDKAFFWSGKSNGIGGKDFAMNHAAKNGGTTLEGLMKAQGINMPIWDISDPVSVKAWEDASATYARQVSGEVRALIGSNLRPDNVWQTIELQRLMANTNVTKIITIDPNTLAEKVIFWR